MAIVSLEELVDNASNIEWNAQQKLHAEKILDAVESDLEGRLYRTKISPGPPRNELAPILRSGQVATRYPVYSVSKINTATVAVDRDNPTFEDWTLDEGILRYGGLNAPPSNSYLWGGGRAAHTDHIGTVALTYRPGWGKVPALWLAILKKAHAIMSNTQDDSLQVRNTDGSRLPPVVEWTEEDLAALGVYRNLSAWR